MALTLILAAVAGSASAVPITRIYSSGINGGEVTFTDLGSNLLQIEFDNTTSPVMVGPGTYLNSSVINGIVFDIEDDIEALSIVSFTAGNSLPITGWDYELNVDNNITPNNTVVDFSFTATNGINDGIYNADDPGTNLDNAFPDIATLVLQITDPSSWALQAGGISNDILRMQRVGFNGDGSLKIPGEGGTPPVGGVPEPSLVALFSMGLLGMGLSHHRRKRKAS